MSENELLLCLWALMLSVKHWTSCRVSGVWGVYLCRFFDMCSEQVLDRDMVLNHGYAFKSHRETELSDILAKLSSLQLPLGLPASPSPPNCILALLCDCVVLRRMCTVI